MVVDGVKNSTTKESAIHYTITMRVWSQELKQENVGNFGPELDAAVRKAIAGLQSD